MRALNLLTALAVILSGCADKTDPFAQAPDPPVPVIKPEVPAVKPKAMWIDAHANFARLSTKAGIDAELVKIKEYGMNMIYLDVKPGNGYALYKSDFLPVCDRFGDETVTRDYDDYLGYFLEKCEELEIDVVASVVATGFGHRDLTTGHTQGYIFDNLDKWKNLCQVRSVEGDPEKLINICDDKDQPVVMLSPASVEVQNLIVSVCSEIVAKYPKIKGLSLDYLRYCNNDGGWYGMGDIDLQGYADYWNESNPVPREIVTPTGGIGPKFTRWIEYRSATVRNVISQVRDAIKKINPDCELHLWASSHWTSRYSVGQNWASKNYKPSGIQYTETYSRTGFADLLDVFVTGAYATHVWESEDPDSEWTVESLLNNHRAYLKGDCKCYGSIAAYALNASGNADATYLCLRNTDGFMTFELSHVDNRKLWQSTLEGINRYEDSQNK